MSITEISNSIDILCSLALSICICILIILQCSNKFSTKIYMMIFYPRLYKLFSNIEKNIDSFYLTEKSNTNTIYFCSDLFPGYLVVYNLMDEEDVTIFKTLDNGEPECVMSKFWQKLTRNMAQKLLEKSKS